MSSQKSPNSQKMGMSLQIVQKPTLTKCDVLCSECYRQNPDGFFCHNNWKIKNITEEEFYRAGTPTLRDITLACSK
jgi:hypothetical protein